MRLETPEECRTYAEAEFERLVESRPGWHVNRSVFPPAHQLSWDLSRDQGEQSDGGYTIEGKMHDGEFLIWFGNHQVGAGGLNWIMRPAVHVAFEDLWPRSDVLGIRYSLCDVLDLMIQSLSTATPAMLRFDVNTASLT